MKLGVGEIILILLVVTMIFGAGKIPEIGKQIGKGVRDFKKYSTAEDETIKAAKSAPKESEPKDTEVIVQNRFNKN